MRSGSITIGSLLYSVGADGTLDPQPDAATRAKLAEHRNYRLVDSAPSHTERDAAVGNASAPTPAAAVAAPLSASAHLSPNTHKQGRGKRRQ
jgi:hypothetical protein